MTCILQLNRRKPTTSQLSLFTQPQSRIIRMSPLLQGYRSAALPTKFQARAKQTLHLVHQRLQIQILPQMTLAQKMAFWSTLVPYSRLILSRVVQLHVYQTPAASLLRSYPVKAHALHRSTHSRILYLLECNGTTFTTMIGTVIRVRHEKFVGDSCCSRQAVKKRVSGAPCLFHRTVSLMLFSSRFQR